MGHEMLVVQLDPPHLSRSGDWTYRSDSPGRALARLEGVHVVNLDLFHPRRDHLARVADVLVLTMACDPDLLPILADRKARGAPTVYEINDDVSAVQPWNTAYAFYRERDNLQLLLRLAHECEALQLSVPELERLYGCLNPRRAVFPNQLERVPPLRVRGAGEAFVVGWGGSHGHLEDVARIAGPLARWIAHHPDAELHVMGAASVAALFDELPGRQRRHVQPAAIAAYHEFVSGLDVGIAPLDDTAFNRCRSDVKFLEYASRGAVAVVQRGAVYGTVADGRTGLLFDDADELVRHLDRLYADRSLLQRLREGAHAYATTRSEDAQAQARLDFYRALSPPRGGVDDFARIANELGAVTSKRHVELRATRFHELLHGALARRDEANALLDEAQTLEPTSELPALLEGAIDGDAEAYERALAARPASVRARLGLATTKARTGDIAGALAQLVAIGEAHPSYEVSFARAATLADTMGNAADAVAFRAHADALAAPLWPAWLDREAFATPRASNRP